MSGAVFSFTLFLSVFVLIGALSVIKSQGTNRDYLLAGHSIKPWLVALSAVATNNSGYMFIGQIGFTYVYGLSSLWLMVGWILGDFVGSLLVHKKLRMITEKRDFLSFGGALSRWHGTNYRTLRVVVGLITVVFLGAYAAAQFKAGSKALFVLFGWDYASGAIIGAGIVFIYCLAGGIRASIWTDAAQSCVMIGAMALLVYCGFQEIGSWQEFTQALDSTAPGYLNVLPTYIAGGFPTALWIVGWFFGGFAVVGLPHIMVRFMTLDDPAKMPRVRIYYYTWFTLFYAMSICVGLLARVLIPATSGFDAELALPQLSKQLLSPFFVGIILAGLFAATMSTADSLVLSCSAALSRDIIPPEKNSYFVTKLTTAFITLLALAIALTNTGSVFTLVLLAVSVLASAFGPLLILYARGYKIEEHVAILMVVTGGFIAVTWQQLGLSKVIYETAPGMVGGILTFFVLKSLGLNKELKTKTKTRPNDTLSF